MSGNSSILRCLGSTADTNGPPNAAPIGLVLPRPGPDPSPAPTATARLLAQVAAIRVGDGEPDRLLTAFRAAIVYGRRPETSAYAAMLVHADQSGDGTWLPVYTSLLELELAEGRCAWWRTTGADLLDTSLPALADALGQVTVLLDRAGSDPLALPPVGETPATEPVGRPGQPTGLTRTPIRQAGNHAGQKHAGEAHDD